MWRHLNHYGRHDILAGTLHAGNERPTIAVPAG